MGTRSLTYFYSDGKPLSAFYRQMDGYPEGHGVELGMILAPITLVNGYQLDMKAGTHANGPGCLAAQVVAALKNDIGGIYMISPNPEDHKDGWQEYEYHVHANLRDENAYGQPAYDTFIEVTDTENTIFRGSFKQFLTWAKKPKRAKAGGYVPVIHPDIVRLAKPELRTALKNGKVEVTFRKASGEKRVMLCTQNFELIPEEKHPGSSGRIGRNDPHLFKVYDLEKDDWRSFREETVINYEVA